MQAVPPFGLLPVLTTSPSTLPPTFAPSFAGPSLPFHPHLAYQSPITSPTLPTAIPAAVPAQHPHPAVSVSPPTSTTPVEVPQSVSPISNSLKRGSEELLSHPSLVTNGTGMSPTQTMETTNEAKKVKLEHQVSKPSRVLHLRGIPNDASESEIIQLGLPFGRMTNLVLARKKNQALLEMADVSTATTMVNYYTEHKPQIRGRTVYVQFSNHEVLKTESSSQNAGAQAALQAAQQLMGSMEEPKVVLRVIIEHMLYPVTIDVIKQIFSRYGQVLRIVTFNKNNTFQALIEYSDPIAAQTAKVSLNGQNIYNGCCTLRIDFSKLTTLNVKYNNDKSRDYTNPNLPAGETQLGTTLDMGVQGFGVPGVMASPLATVPGYGALTTYGTPTHPHPAGLGAIPAGVPFGPLSGLPGAQAAALQQGLRLPGQPQTGTVLLVSNLNEQRVSADALFTLFGVYGDVHRVKIMFNKKDNALVQFADPLQAQQAMNHLDKAQLWEKPLKVAPSKHSLVQMPKEGQPDAGLTKDYTNSPLHRFKKPNSKNHHNIFPPSAVLHLSNIPPTISEEHLRELFTQCGTVDAFKFFQKDRKMALIQMSTVEEGTHGLIALHNHDLGNSHHLRVSFTKSVI